MKTILIILSANAEWQAAKAYYRDVQIQMTPYGEFFEIRQREQSRVYLQGGWGKISSAASAQYGIQRWDPVLVINIGTCGGFAGRIKSGTIILVERTCVYDILEQMGDADQALEFYSVSLDLNWLKTPYPQPVLRGLLLSADRDIVLDEISGLVDKFNGVAADWESGAIAWVCKQNEVRTLILRGVSDIVGVNGAEAYGTMDFFQQSSQNIVTGILKYLDFWIVSAGIP
ncbi:MAG: 5'-methylthioadenosine/S-adenosylhomocysteine nucleosidase [Anaerolineaceae bacterium]|nr:5'-methylthioadenosine/S-adenosylhomocysteine nucleosidase [Anaerolineaceae bacterium]